jgi:hypothetical protein
MKYTGVDNWVAVFEAAMVDEADIVKGVLEAAKIPVILDRDAAGSELDLADGSVNEVVVKVPKEMVAKVVQLLQGTPYGVPVE